MIQTGLQLLGNWNGFATVYAAEYEYATPGQSGCYNTECFMLNVSPGDTAYVQSWACDSQGNDNFSGGYGCFFYYDTTTYQFGACDLSTGSCPSLPQKKTFQGLTAEAIAENNSVVGPGWCGAGGTFDDFGSTNLTLDAYNTSAPGTTQNYTTVSNATITLVNGSGTAMDQVLTDDASPDGTSFSWSRGS